MPASDIKSLKSDANVLALPAKSGLLSPEELEITSKYDVVALSENLRSDTFSALAVATAFCKRAAIAHQAVRYAGSDCGIALKCFFTPIVSQRYSSIKHLLEPSISMSI